MIPDTDSSWLELRDFLQAQATPTDAILAPIDFLDEFPSQSYPYNVTGALSPDQFTFIAFHKGMLADVNLGSASFSRFWQIQSSWFTARVQLPI
jgi:hypothetical protein